MRLRGHTRLTEARLRQQHVPARNGRHERDTAGADVECRRRRRRVVGAGVRGGGQLLLDAGAALLGGGRRRR